MTEAADGPQAVAAALRELAFYERVARQLDGVSPRLLEVDSSVDGVALLLEDAGQVAPPTAWDDARWHLLGVTIHRVHQVDAGGGAELEHDPALDRAMTRPDRGVIEQFWATLSPSLPGVLAMVDELYPSVRTTVFVHGDLHTDNVVTQPGSDHHHLILLDWQQCGYASAMADLALVNVRLAPSGRVAPATFLDSYASSGGLDPDEVRHAVLLAELATYLYLWPPFAAYNSREGVQRVRDRVAALARSVGREVPAPHVRRGAG